MLAAGDFNRDGQIEIVVTGASDARNELRVINIDGEVVDTIVSPSLDDDYFGFGSRLGSTVITIDGISGAQDLLAVADWVDGQAITRIYQADEFFV